jgi:chitosanase
MQLNFSDMTFTRNDRSKALAIVNIFETSRPFGDYAAYAVLDDGAGVSYGISQFTHKSGSLAAVVETYLKNGGKVGAEVLAAALPKLNRTSLPAINKLASDERFKKALRSAAVTREMKAAQQQVATEKYLRPALQICAAMNFVLPLSLAVVYDSLMHGSWERIAARVTPLGVKPIAYKDATLTEDAALTEKEWITEYVRKRDFWLCNIRRLKATSYRTKFFLDQIAVGNWDLRLPVRVHGFRLSDALLPSDDAIESEPEAGAIGAIERPADKSILSSAGEVISAAVDKFDRVDHMVTTVTSRKDAAKSMWTTIIGTIWQVVWAIFGFVTGLPTEVWIVVAVMAAVLMLLYLYRQIELGRIREAKN